MIYKKYTPAGGQALIEGVMMKCGNSKAIAIRKPDGKISVKRQNIGGQLSKGGFRKLPFVRGVFTLIDSMVEGGKDMTYSADAYSEGIEEEKGKVELWLEKIFGDKLDKVFTAFSLALSVLLAVGLFIVLPTFFAKGSAETKTAVIALREGLMKIGIFIAYLLAMSQMKDIKRVFQYHGAEHKSIFAYEKGLELTVENVRKMPRLHPRCGTNFMFVVILISIIIFTFVNVRTLWLRSLIKLLAFPLVSGIAYEVIRLAGKYQNAFTKAMIMPGLLMQYITTKEPDDGQIEVAIASLKAVLEDEGILEKEGPEAAGLPPAEKSEGLSLEPAKGEGTAAQAEIESEDEENYDQAVNG